MAGAKSLSTTAYSFLRPTEALFYLVSDNFVQQVMTTVELSRFVCRRAFAATGRCGREEVRGNYCYHLTWTPADRMIVGYNIYVRINNKE